MNNHKSILVEPTSSCGSTTLLNFIYLLIIAVILLCQYPYLQIFSGYASYSRLNYKFLEVSKFLWYNHILGIVLPSETFQSNENIYWVPTLIESKVFYKNMLALILMLSLTDS